jgi:hypothetical protein
MRGHRGLKSCSNFKGEATTLRTRLARENTTFREIPLAGRNPHTTFVTTKNAKPHASTTQNQILLYGFNKNI